VKDLVVPQVLENKKNIRKYRIYLRQFQNVRFLEPAHLSSYEKVNAIIPEFLQRELDAGVGDIVYLILPPEGAGRLVLPVCSNLFF
jgi:hypothetical protein